MITAVDTNVLLDLLIPGSSAMDSAVDQLERASGEGKLILSEVVYAELATHFPTNVPNCGKV
jgi:predicted nucleic acid-binding protein